MLRRYGHHLSEGTVMIDANIVGAPCWVDLSTPHLAGASRFYSALLGWDIERHESPAGDHLICRVGQHEVAGMMAVGPDENGMPARWTLAFHVLDVDAATEAVIHAGGRLLEPPFDLPDARVAIVADPTGATFALMYNPGLPSKPWLSHRAGAVCWVELLTRDLATAEAFYASVFGWKAETQHYGEVVYTSFEKDDMTVGGMMMMPDTVPTDAPALWSVYFAVDDCADAERRAVELGGLSLKATAEAGDGRFAVLADPEGGTFQLMEEGPAT